MWFRTKQFNEESDDLKKMVHLICVLNSEEIYDWSLGRIIDWKYGLWREEKQKTCFFEKTTTLWYSYLDELTGFVLSENGSNELQYVISNKYSFLYEDMINFTKGRYETIETVCSINDTIKIDYLLKNGFVDAGEHDATYVYNAQDISFVKAFLPTNYSIQTMDTYTNYASQIELKRNAFGGNREFSSKDYYAFEFVRTSPIYDPSMDFVVINDLQEAVAGCEGFIDYQNSIMEVERVCTHSDYRQRGLAKAVINECIKQGLKRGIKRIHISGWNDITKRIYSSYGKSQQIIKHQFIYNGNS